MESIINNSSHNPLDRFTHIILDEVHERGKDMDFLMIAIYKYLNPKIRIILMSATIDVKKVLQFKLLNAEILINIVNLLLQFARYYQTPDNFKEGKAPIIELGFRSNYEVTKIFLDDIEEMVYILQSLIQLEHCLIDLIFFRISREESTHQKLLNKCIIPV